MRLEDKNNIDTNTYLSNSKNNQIIINTNYQMDYNYYKKKLIKEIFLQLDIIFEIFDEELNENIVKVYILIIKSKIPENIFSEILVFYEFLSDLKNLDYIDQMDYLNIIIDLFKINKSLEKIDSFFIKNNSEIGIYNLVNWLLIKNKFITLIELISKHNIILKLLLKLDEYQLDLIKIHHKEIKLTVRNLADSVCFDFFMYYSSSKILKYLNTKLLIDSQNLTNDSNNCISLLNKYKKYFTEQYKLKYETFCEIYFDIKIANISKFKYINKNKYFDELLLDIKSVDNSYKA